MYVLVLNSTSLSLIMRYVPGFIGDVSNEIQNESISISLPMTLEKKFFPVEVFQVTDVLGNNTKTNKKSTLCWFIKNVSWTMLCIVTENISPNLKFLVHVIIHLKSYYSYLRHCFNCFFKGFCYDKDIVKLKIKLYKR